MFPPQSDRSLIRRYYLYRATLSVGFITPIFTLFLLRSLTFTQLGALSALYGRFRSVGEIPTGYVGDRLGRRASLLLSVLSPLSRSRASSRFGIRWYGSSIAVGAGADVRSGAWTRGYTIR